MFREGDRVQCIRGNGSDLKTGHIYTVHSCRMRSSVWHNNDEPTWRVSLVEYPSSQLGNGWFANRFILAEKELSLYQQWEKSCAKV